MAALDTNVLVRFLVQDDPSQSAAARRLIRGYVAENQALFVPVTVTLELEWVLRSIYGYSKPSTIGTLATLFSATELLFESERALEVALELYRGGTADFSDCLHIALAAQANEAPLWTFDKKAARIGGARSVGR